MKNILFLSFTFMLFGSGISSASDMTMTPIDIVVSSDGTQAVSQMLVTYSDGVSEVLTVYVDDTTVSTAGTSRVPGVSSITYEPIFGPCEPDPATGVCSLSTMGDDDIQLQGAGGAIGISIGICAVGHMAGRMLNYMECRDEGGISSSTVQWCGILGGTTSVTCNNSPHDPPEPPEPEPGPGPDIPPCEEGGLCDDLWQWTYDFEVPGTCLHFMDVCF